MFVTYISISKVDKLEMICLLLLMKQDSNLERNRILMTNKNAIGQFQLEVSANFR